MKKGPPGPDTHEQRGQVFYPREAPSRPPTVQELADQNAFTEPTLDAQEFIDQLDREAKEALAKVVSPQTIGDHRNYWAGVMYAISRMQHRILFKTEPPAKAAEE